MEIYSQTATSVTIPMPAGFNTTTVKVYQNGVQKSYGNPASLTSESITVAIPYGLTKIDCTLRIVVDFRIDFDWEKKTVDVDVVTPLISFDEVKQILNPTTPSAVTDATAQDLERKVRLAIQACTGQVFGKYEGFVSAYGTNEDYILSPRRIIWLEGVYHDGRTYSPNSYTVTGNGYYVQRSHSYPLTIKQAPPESELDAYAPYYTNGAITPPSPSFYTTFNKNVTYTLVGAFGYSSVPNDVQQAARILCNDYGCNESLYRDRYIKDIRAADWRFEFKDGAYVGTGNVMADQLLDPYKRNNMVVI